VVKTGCSEGDAERQGISDRIMPDRAVQV
jgi:hypothetical protein